VQALGGQYGTLVWTMFSMKNGHIPLTIQPLSYPTNENLTKVWDTEVVSSVFVAEDNRKSLLRFVSKRCKRRVYSYYCEITRVKNRLKWGNMVCL